MQVAAELSWQWRPDAAITASDSTQRATALALQYADCSVVRVRPSEWPCSRQETGPETENRDVELHGHQDRITSLRFHAFHDSPEVLLASASSDSVLVWHFDSSFQASKSVVVEKSLAEPTSVAFDHTGTLLAVACDREIEVRIVHSGDVLATLEGHLARVTKCEFHPIRQHLLITCSEDRTFKIWDLAAKTLLFQSAVLSAFPILSLAINSSTGDASFGFGDGSIRIFTIHESFAREYATLNVETYMRKLVRKKQRQEEIKEVLRESPNVISSLPPWARSDRAQETAQTQALVANSATRVSYSDFNERRKSLALSGEEANAGEIACPVLAMRYLCVETLNSERYGTDADPVRSFNAHGDQGLLDREQFLVVAVPSHLIAINAFSHEMRILQDFQLPLTLSEGETVVDPVTVAKDLSFHTPDGADVIYCGVASAFVPCFTMVCATITHDRRWSSDPVEATQSTSNQSEEQVESTSTAAVATSSLERLSVIATGPPPKDSVLNLPPLSTTKTLPATTKKNAKTLDKPITFRTRIKSSGYGTPSQPFPSKRSSLSDRKPAQSVRPKASVESFLKEYPSQCGLLQHFQAKHALPPKTLHHGAIHHIEFSTDAKWLASAGNDKLALVSKLPFSKFQGEGNVFCGHDHAVRAIHWSHNNQLVLTTSSDKTARVWLADSDLASLTLQSGAPKAALAMTPFSSAKKAMKQDMVDAMFFYMDKFILSASGNAVRLHQFEIDEVFARAQTKKVKKNDFVLEDNKSRKKKVAQWLFPDMQALTSVACVNGSFLSSIVIAGGSDRSLRILDAAVGRTARVISDAHVRAPHAIALPRASCFVSLPANFYDLLLSSAPNSTIHLWDIRADNCVMRFGEHVNRVHQLGVAFSPCMRYVATGSEDRQTYMYDIRTGRCLTKLAGHSDVVTCVAFNPLHAQLATASYDGTVRFYSDACT